MLIIFLIRFEKGNSGHVSTIYEIFEKNTDSTNLLMFFVNISMFGEPFWFLSAKGYKFCDDKHKDL